MFEVGFQELVVIALLALIVLGPEKLPKLAAKLGRWTGQARSMARHFRHQLEQEVSYDELLKQKQAAEEALRQATEKTNTIHTDTSVAKDLGADATSTTDSATSVPLTNIDSANQMLVSEAKPSVTSTSS